MLTKEEYEERINRAALFGLDKEREPIRYETERRIFLKLLTEYYAGFIYPNKPLEDFSFTLIETAVECIRFYKASKGEFLHLFNKAMKRNQRIAVAKENAEKFRQGIRLGKEENTAIRKVIALAKRKGLDIYETDCQRKIALFLQMDPERVAQLILINENATAVSNRVKGEDGEIDLFDKIIDTSNSADDKIINQMAAVEILKIIESEFSDCQERQKRMLSLMLTTEVVKAFDEDIEQARRTVSGFSFCSEECFLYYKENGSVLTARQIAQKCGTSEQSLSRAYKNFKEKVKSRRLKYVRRNEF